MSETNPSTEERIARRKAADDEFRKRLSGNHFDGPHEIKGGSFDPLSAMFGGGPFRYAICLICGAMIRLDDPTEGLGGVVVERGLGKHIAFHDRHGDYDGDLTS